MEATRILAPHCPRPLVDLCELLVDALGSDWAAVTQRDGYLLAGAGALPDLLWLRGFSSGAACSPDRSVVDEAAVFHRVGDGGLVASRSTPGFSGEEIEDLKGWAAVAQLITLDRASP